MPGVSEHHGDACEHHAVNPESIPLCLPSGAPQQVKPSVDLAEKEKRLRLAQAHDSLTELRRLLWITVGLWEYKYSQLGPSQRANTRARSLISRFMEKINRVAERYRAARGALLILDPTGSWSRSLLELKQEHIKGPGRDKEDKSEGRREISWIWLASPSSDVSDNVDTNASEEEIGNSECKQLLHVIF